MNRPLNGPTSLPLIGNLIDLTRDPLTFLTRCAAIYGDVAHYRVLNVDVYLLNRPDLIEEVLLINSRNFIKGRALSAGRQLFGNGLLTSEGESWLWQRKLMQPAFHRERVSAYVEPIIKHGQRLLSAWQAVETCDLEAELMRLTLAIACETLFGASVEPAASASSAALRQFFDQFRRRINSALLIPEWLPTPDNLRLRRAVRQLDGVIQRIIDQRRSADQGQSDLLSLLLQAQGEDRRLTDRLLRDEVMTLFVAGHETTALALTWTLYLLAQHPAVEAKLFDEICRVMGRRVPALTDLPQLAYADSVIKESMRLYPPVWVLSRVALNDFKVDGLVIRQGSSIALSQWVMHRDPRYFDRPAEFAPERWTAEFTQHLPKFAYFPFGGGAHPGAVARRHEHQEAGLAHEQRVPIKEMKSWSIGIWAVRASRCRPSASAV